MDRGEERGHYNKWLWLVSTLPSRFIDPTAYATLPKRKLIFYFYNSAFYNSALPFRFSFAQLHAGPLPIFVKKRRERKKKCFTISPCWNGRPTERVSHPKAPKHRWSNYALHGETLCIRVAFKESVRPFEHNLLLFGTKVRIAIKQVRFEHTLQKRFR